MALRPCATKFGKFTVLKPGEASKTLAGGLAPCVDAIRDLYTATGLRPYTVRLVWTRWSGGERGDGVEEVIREIPLLPTPKVSSVESLNKTNTAVGITEYGQLSVAEIPTRYTEDILSGRFDGRPIPADQNFYWEIEAASTERDAVVKRRFTPASSPELKPGAFQWTMKIVRAGSDRTRIGMPED